MIKKYFVIICLLITSLFGSFTISLSSYLPIQDVSARCPTGYHKSPSGDCEKVIDTKGMPRCPNGYHRSPYGDCELVSEDDDSNSDKISKNNNYNSKKDNNYLDYINTKIMIKRILINLIIH